MNRKYLLNWDKIGDVELGRPELGHRASVESYRLMHFALKDSVEEMFGTQVADQLFYNAGYKAGLVFYNQFIEQTTSLDVFINQLKNALKSHGIGLLELESFDPTTKTLILTISEDIECSGVSEVNHKLCGYDEGFLCAIIELFLKEPYSVQEIDCWGTGERTCRFKARPQNGN